MKSCFAPLSLSKLISLVCNGGDNCMLVMLYTQCNVTT